MSSEERCSFKQLVRVDLAVERQPKLAELLVPGCQR